MPDKLWWVKPRLLILAVTVLLILLLVFKLFSYSNSHNRPPKLKAEENPCYIEDVAQENYPELSKKCLDSIGDSGFYNIEKSEPSENFETIYDRDLGYKVTKPVGAEEYVWNISTNPVDKYQVDTGLRIKEGKDSYYRYKVTKFYKFPEDTLEQTIADMVESVGEGNALYFTKDTSEFVKNFSLFFPSNYEIIYTRLKSWDTVKYGSTSEALVTEGVPTYFFIYNPDYPYMFFRFDTADLSMAKERNYTEDGWVEYWHEELTDEVNHYYLPNGVPWQTTFRIIEGDRPFESLYKSHGVPKDLDLAIIKPMSLTFDVRDTKYEFYTPGNQKEGYNFDVVAFGISRDDSMEAAETESEEPLPAERTHTIPEVREHLKPVAQKYTKEGFGRRTYVTGESLRGYWENVDGHNFISLGVAGRPLEFDSTVIGIWFSEDSFKWVLIDRPKVTDEGVLEHKVTEYNYAPPEYHGYSSWPVTLVSKKEFQLNLHQISSDAADYGWTVTLQDSGGSKALLKPRLYSERVSYYQGDPWACEDLSIDLDQAENGHVFNVYEETELKKTSDSSGQKYTSRTVRCSLN